jgi:hypothetical protein
MALHIALISVSLKMYSYSCLSISFRARVHTHFLLQDGLCVGYEYDLASSHSLRTLARPKDMENGPSPG